MLPEAFVEMRAPPRALPLPRLPPRSRAGVRGARRRRRRPHRSATARPAARAAAGGRGGARQVQVTHRATPVSDTVSDTASGQQVRDRHQQDDRRAVSTTARQTRRDRRRQHLGLAEVVETEVGPPRGLAAPARRPRRRATPSAPAPLASTIADRLPPSSRGQACRLRAPAGDRVLEVADHGERDRRQSRPVSSRAARAAAHRRGERLALALDRRRVLARARTAPGVARAAPPRGRAPRRRDPAARRTRTAPRRPADTASTSPRSIASCATSPDDRAPPTRRASSRARAAPPRGRPP